MCKDIFFKKRCKFLKKLWCCVGGSIIKLVVIKDYESAFDAVTLIQIFLADFEPLSVAKIGIFSSATGVLPERYFSDEVHAILIEEVPIQTTLRDGASFRRLTSF